MKKQKTSDLLIGMWNCVDQAGLDKMIEEAFCLIPQKDQLRFIESLTTENPHVDNAEELERWHELKYRALSLIRAERERRERIEDEMRKYR